MKEFIGWMNRLRLINEDDRKDPEVPENAVTHDGEVVTYNGEIVTHGV